MDLEGTIIRGYSGFYYVWDGATLWECKLRGRYKISENTFLPGDKVRFKILDAPSAKAVIEFAYPRKNELIRPSICNVDQALIVMAIKDPEADLWLVDRLLINLLFNNIEPIICFSKADLVSLDSSREIYNEYRDSGFPRYIISIVDHRGVDQLRQLLKGKISVLSGPSGVGKSSIINIIEPALQRKTGEISLRSSRGKHTTRSVELLPLSTGGYVADTPGFSQMHLPDIKKERLAGYYKEFDSYAPFCKFSSCLHRDEPQCAVRDAVDSGMISSKRYRNYLLLLKEIIEKKRRY